MPKTTLHVSVLRHRESITAGLLGFIFFAVTVGVEKIDPRNISWLTFKDQRAHWMGWLFFADDHWRWPLGAIPLYGWGEANSVVNTDSWPLFALIFKVVNLEVFDRGQYFGLALALSSVALFIGADCLFRLLGLPHGWSLVASTILATTPIFWWMQRWYAGMSGGLCLLVWAFYFYFRTRRESRFRISSWLLILLLAIATNFYLFAIIVPVWLASLLSPGILSRTHICRIASTAALTVSTCALAMYALGYFIMPLSSSSTGRYGIYTANLLGLFDVNSSSRLLPEIPSPPLQYEPTSLGIGTLLILVLAFLHFLLAPRRIALAVAPRIRRHAWLIAAVLASFAFSVSNYITIGDRGYNFEIHYRAWQLFSIFQSSVRFIWPLTVLTSVILIVIAFRRQRVGVVLLVVACVLQIFDVWPQFRSVARRADGVAAPIQFQESLWSAVPEEYKTLAVHPPVNIRTGWDECAFAAVMTDRAARCAYFSRTFDLQSIAEKQSSDLLSGTVENNIVYWLSQSWIIENAEALRQHHGVDSQSFVLPAEGTVAYAEYAFYFPRCERFENCAFLSDQGMTLDEIVALTSAIIK